MTPADFRIGGHVFATLAAEALRLRQPDAPPKHQAQCLADGPNLFLPVPGGWGRMGITHIRLAHADEMTLSTALRKVCNLRVQKNTRARSRRPKALISAS